MTELSPTKELSTREIRVCRLVALGLTNKEIGHSLHISEETVKSHLIRIKDKLEAGNRANLVYVAHKRGIIE